MMAFLEVNGLSVSVASRSHSNNPIDIGSTGRAYSGTKTSDRRSRKDIYSDETTLLSEMDAKALVGVIAGLGDAWPFNHEDAALLTPDFYSAKGLPKESGTVGSVRFGGAVDGDPVTDINDVAESKYGSGALAVDTATTNLLTNNQADLEDGTTTGFTPLVVVSSSVASVTTHKLQGARSLEVTTGGIGDGVTVDAISGSGTGNYSASLYCKADSARNLTFLLFEGANLRDSVGHAMVADTWTRVELSGVSSTTAVMSVVAIESGGSGKFYLDALQIVKNTTPQTWQDPANGTRAAGDFGVPATAVSNTTGDLTVNMWLKAPTANPASNAVYFVALVNSVEVFKLVRLTGGTLRYQTVGPTTTDNVNVAAPGFDDDWHMVTIVFRRNPETGESTKEIYIDAASEGTSTPADIPDLATVDEVTIGNSSGSNLSDALHDDLQILPWAATQAQVTAWYGMGVAMPTTPRVRLTGDVTERDSVLVEGRVVRESVEPVAIGGTWKNNARRISFTLDEV
jgi:hypothetical protein